MSGERADPWAHAQLLSADEDPALAAELTEETREDRCGSASMTRSRVELRKPA
jgi:hypothetical protein